jgi:lipopolysaccharide export system protein LptA
MTMRSQFLSSHLLRACVAGIAMFGGLATVYAQGAPKAGGGATKTAATTTTSTGQPNALQGFSQNRDKPIQIDAARLEVRDKDKVATFFGDAKADVKVIQGDTTMRSKVLVVFYEQDDKSGKTQKAASPGPGGSSNIKRLEAKGNVIVTQKEQTVTGNEGIFEMKTNTITMHGNVVMTQNDNVIKGDKLIVNMETGLSRVEMAAGGRVNALLKGNPNKDSKDSKDSAAKDKKGPLGFGSR